MSTSLISSLIDLTNSGVSSRMAIELGAAEGAIVRAFRAAFAAILTGIVNKAGNPGGLSEIFYLASQVPADSLKSTGTHEGDSDWHTEPLITNANRLLSIVFEDKQHALLGAISQHAGRLLMEWLP